MFDEKSDESFRFLYLLINPPPGERGTLFKLVFPVVIPESSTESPNRDDDDAKSVGQLCLPTTMFLLRAETKLAARSNRFWRSFLLGVVTIGGEIEAVGVVAVVDVVVEFWLFLS